MKNDLFFMATCLLTVWKEGSLSNYVAAAWTDSSFVDYKTYIMASNQDPVMLILEVFGDADIDHKDSSLYLTQTPSENFIKVAKNKGVSRIVFINNKKLKVSNDNAEFLIPFNYTFGKIIDIFSQFDAIASS